MTSIEMPRYQSHKNVWALKIKEIHFDSATAVVENRDTNGGAIIIPEEPQYGPINVDRAYCEKHQPQVGGYYVVYENGYTSFSPSEPFESGHTLMSSDSDMNRVKVVYETQWKAVNPDKEYPHGWGFQAPLVEFSQDADPAYCIELCKSLSNDEFICYGAVPRPKISGYDIAMVKQRIMKFY